MPTPKILFLKGLPASGKSTYAKELVATGKWKRVNKDDIRAMLDNSKWSKHNESFVKDVEDNIVIAAITRGYNVVVDDTNLVGNHIARVTEKVQNLDITCYIEEKFIDTPLSECIRRDLSRPNGVGKKVIRRMYESAKNLYVAQYETSPDKPWCIIVDIDGTLAHMNGRSPYDYTQVHTDLPDPIVVDLVRRYSQQAVMDEMPENYVVIVSGRDDTCKPETEAWLAANGIQYDELHMRDTNRVDDAGNQIDDRIIKREIFDTWIRDRYNVRFVLDDRNRVVEMWRGLGLKVLQVNEGDF